MEYVDSYTRKRRATARLNYARRIAQEWRTLQREGVLYTINGPVTAAEWRDTIRGSVRRKTGDTGNYGVAEAAICEYVVKRDSVKYEQACRLHVGRTRNASGPDASKVYKRVAKWRAIANERNRA